MGNGKRRDAWLEHGLAGEQDGSRELGSQMMMSKKDQANRRLVYAVSVMHGTTWKSGSASSTLDEALAQARNLVTTRRFAGVRVEQHFTDPLHKRTVTTRVFEEFCAPAARKEVSVWLLLGLAVGLGVAAFCITWLYLNKGRP